MDVHNAKVQNDILWCEHDVAYWLARLSGDS